MTYARLDSRPPGGRAYKALVVLFLNGGVDSWNMLVPHSGCQPGNASANYETYAYLRGGVAEGVALRQEDLLPIDIPGRLASQLVLTCELARFLHTTPCARMRSEHDQ